ncbi:MAG TPA: hypothetical protein VN735_07915 [Steroidobacteraceae bacterium]|nr:hypothetical protein [Steroidobacteraceae bacterium]
MNALLRHPLHRLLLMLLTVPLIAAAAPVPSRYLFVWAMEAQRPRASTQALMSPDLAAWRNNRGLGKDFLAVFDVRTGASFGRLVAMLPVGNAAMAHHTNYVEPPNDLLYANDWIANRTYVFDLHDPTHPHLARKFGSVGIYSYPHSFVYLSNGNTLATFQYSGGFNRAAGGLVEFDPQGRVVRTASAAVAGHPNIRPYSLAVAEKLDRVVTGSADMMGAQVSHVAQVWRLSDLKPVGTMQLPPQADWFYDTAADSSEPRVLADGNTVVVPTFNCGLYLARNLASDHPTLQHVYDFGYRTCEVPVVAGDYLVETMQSGHAIASLDLRDPEHPREVSRILLPPDEYPHWLALEPGGDRLVITGYGALATRARFAVIDRRTGKLTLEQSVIDFNRVWPDGWHGSAVPHGAVFSNPQDSRPLGKHTSR